MSDRDLSPAEHNQRQTAALKHGASSELQLKRVGTIQKRRLLRQVGLRQSDLSGIGYALLDNWARAQSKVELLDSYAAEHGFLDEDGAPREFVRVYFTALNSARLALTKLEEYLRAETAYGDDPIDVLIQEGSRIREEREAQELEGERPQQERLDDNTSLLRTAMTLSSIDDQGSPSDEKRAEPAAQTSPSRQCGGSTLCRSS